jgi:hypothetical protein
MIDKCQTSDDEISDLVFIEELKYVFKIADALHIQDVPFAPPWVRNRDCSTFAISLRIETRADKRCSGVWPCQKSKSHISASSKFAAR